MMMIIIGCRIYFPVSNSIQTFRGVYFVVDRVRKLIKLDNSDISAEELEEEYQKVVDYRMKESERFDELELARGAAWNEERSRPRVTRSQSRAKSLCQLWDLDEYRMLSERGICEAVLSGINVLLIMLIIMCLQLLQ